MSVIDKLTRMCCPGGLYIQASVYELASAGTPVLQVTATDVECSNSSCIIYGLEPAHDDHNSMFVINPRTGSSRFRFFPTVDQELISYHSSSCSCSCSSCSCCGDQLLVRKSHHILTYLRFQTEVCF